MLATSDWEKTSGYNPASDSAKGSYVEVQKISLAIEQIASDVGTLAYGRALILEQYHVSHLGISSSSFYELVWLFVF